MFTPRRSPESLVASLRGRWPLATLLLLASCAVAPADGRVPSDGGAWQIEVTPTELGVGWQDLDIAVFAADSGALDPSAPLVARAWMPTMGHGSVEDSTLEAAGDGTWTLHVLFQMSGAWDIEGTVGEEEFSAPVEVIEQ